MNIIVGGLVTPTMFLWPSTLQEAVRAEFNTTFLCRLILSGVWAIHESNFSGNFSPLKFSFEAASAAIRPQPLARLQKLFPFEELVCESQVRLNDDIQTSSPNKAICSWERKIQFAHHLSDADRGTSRNTHATMDQSCRAISPSTI